MRYRNKSSLILPLFFGIGFLFCSQSTNPKQQLNPPGTVQFTEPEITGNFYFVDPVNGSMDNDGSESKPWKTLQQVFDSNLVESYEFTDHPYTEGTLLQIKNQGAPVKAGDALILLNGYHGSIDIRDYQNNDYITIKAKEEHSPEVSFVSISSCAYWHVKGLSVSPSFANAFEKKTMAALQSHNWHGPISHVILNSCSLYSVTDISSWSADDWNEKACNGISVNGDSMYIINNHIKNSNFGLTFSCNKSIAYGNIIENFCGDGMRGLGNDLIFESNVVKNCYDVNDNHDDGFQSWSINDDPPRERVVLRGNLIINYEDANQPLKGTLQGIGCFDGPYVDWVVENNVVIVDHWHGISFYGAHNCRIINNTVIDPNKTKPGPCWIRITDHKNKTPSTNSVIRNNIAPSIKVAEGVSEDHNFEIESFDSVFVDWQAFNLRLIPGAPVIDSGSSELAPIIDFDGNKRPAGNGIDIGAFEYTQ